MRRFLLAVAALITSLSLHAAELTCFASRATYESLGSRVTRTIWRSGSLLARVEERERDRGITSLIVVSWPNAWVVDREKRIVRRNSHGERVYVPLFNEISELEFGHEYAFFPQDSFSASTLGRKKALKSASRTNAGLIEAWFDAEDKTPLLIKLNGKPSQLYRYEQYTFGPCDSSLFDEPEGYQFK